MTAFDRGQSAGMAEDIMAVALRGGDRVALLLRTRHGEVSGRVDEALTHLEDLAALDASSLANILGAAGDLVRLRASGRALALVRKARGLDPGLDRARRRLTE